MNTIYFFIVLLTVYGDLLKRYLPANLAVGILYGLAFAILIWMIISKPEIRQNELSISSNEKNICNCIYFLMCVYIIELVLGNSNDFFFNALSSSIYVLLPLSYTLVLIKYKSQFNGITLSHIFHVSMIPVNMIGLIQNNIDAKFFISTSYVEDGGIIYRNLLEGGSFSRLPSIFVSADRYSAMGLIQLYLAFVLFLDPEMSKKPQLKIGWILFNVLGALIAMFISGARSRLLITLFIFILLGFTIFLMSFSPHKNTHNKTNFFLKEIAILLLSLVFVILIFGLIYPEQSAFLGEKISSLPVFGFLQQTLESGDAVSRTDQAFQISLIPEDVSLFGKGLGSLGNKPSEFGIGALWVESGLLFGSAKLAAFAGIIITFALLAFQSFIKIQPVRLVLFVTPALMISFGLLSGITGVLEFSSGILICICIGFIVKYPLD